ncbi:MAG TPA: murein transglycosylase A [Steroidobacteraceae bacterium]|nr:murein transglycosylase A [Steroidobacteraceae bacterium]
MTGRCTAAVLAAVLLLLAGCRVAPRVEYVAGRWSELPGWRQDAVGEAWPALLSSCRVRSRPEWDEVCTAAAALSPASDEAIRAFLAAKLVPLRVIRSHPGARTGLLTGYFEPQLRGSRSHLPGFDTPLYAPPDDLLTVDLAAVVPELKGKRVRGRLAGKTVVPYFSREQLPDAPALKGREIVWVDNALDAFLLEVQGSGRVRLQDGTVIRLGFADQNGYPYRSIGRYLVSRGELTLEQADVPGIRAWLDAHPGRLREVLDANPSVVFFQELPLGDPALGPRGAQGIALTAGRSIAVDPAYIPLGSPVYLAAGAANLRRLVIAQDTGGAIAGAPRADLFCGVGDAAASLAGTLRAQADVWLLWPRHVMPPGTAVVLQNSRQILPK